MRFVGIGKIVSIMLKLEIHREGCREGKMSPMQWIDTCVSSGCPWPWWCRCWAAARALCVYLEVNTHIWSRKGGGWRRIQGKVRQLQAQMLPHDKSADELMWATEWLRLDFLPPNFLQEYLLRTIQPETHRKRNSGECSSTWPSWYRDEDNVFVLTYI